MVDIDQARYVTNEMNGLHRMAGEVWYHIRTGRIDKAKQECTDLLNGFDRVKRMYEDIHGKLNPGDAPASGPVGI